MPPVSDPSSESQAPQPSIAIWVPSRKNFENAGHDDVAVLGADLRLQRLGRLAPPHHHAFRDHAHGVDDLGIARHRLRLQIGAGRERAGARERHGRELLVEIGDENQHERGDGDDVAEMRVDQIDRQQIDRRRRRIEHGEDHRTGQEAADLLEIGKRLEFAAGATLRRLGRGAEHRPAEPAFDIHGDPHQHEAAHHVEQDMRQDRDHHDDRQHHQRIEAAARQHPVRHLEQVDRHGEHQRVDHQREDRDDQHVAARVGEPLAENLLEIPVAQALLDRRTSSRTAAATASPAAALAAAARTIRRGDRHGAVEGASRAKARDAVRSRGTMLRLGPRRSILGHGLCGRLLVGVRDGGEACRPQFADAWQIYGLGQPAVFGESRWNGWVGFIGHGIAPDTCSAQVSMLDIR